MLEELKRLGYATEAQPQFLERSVFFDELSAESVAALAQRAQEQWRRVHDETIDQAIAAGAGMLTPGTRVQVRGRKLAGTVVAGEFRQIAASARIEYIVQGEVTDFISLANFKVRGEAISAATALFTGGTPAMLANGRQVRVKAVAGPGHLSATELTFLP